MMNCFWGDCMNVRRIISAGISLAVVAFCSAFGVAILGRAEVDPDRFAADNGSITETDKFDISTVTERLTEKVTEMSVSTTVLTTVGTTALTTVNTVTTAATDTITQSAESETFVKSETTKAEETTLQTEVVTEAATVPVTEPMSSEAQPVQSVEPPAPETSETPITEFIVVIPESASEFQREVLRLVNEKRREAGLQEFSGGESLNNAADVRAGEIAELFAHERPDGRAWYSVIEDYSINSAGNMGENIAAGLPTPAQVVDQWMESQGHYENIMNPAFKHLGIGYFEIPDDTYRYYWVQIFTG